MNKAVKTKGIDGKLYMMGDGNDYEKYKTLSEEEMAEGDRMNLQMAESLNITGGKLDAQGEYRTKNPTSFVPPQLGTSSKGRKKEKNAWDKKTEEPRVEEPGDTDAASGRELNTDLRLSSDERLMSAVATMQEKYTENLSVIEQLFSEKRQMEERMAAMEEELQRTKREQARAEDVRRQVQAKDRLNQTAPGLAQGRGLDLDNTFDNDHEEVGRGWGRDSLSRSTPASLPTRGRRVRSPSPSDDDGWNVQEYEGEEGGALAGPRYAHSPPRPGRSRDDLATATQRVSAADMASLLAEEPLHQATAHSTRDSGRSGGGSERGRSSDGRSKAAAKWQGIVTTVRRSQSLTRPRSAGLSASLQADTDR